MSTNDEAGATNARFIPTVSGAHSSAGLGYGSTAPAYRSRGFLGVLPLENGKKWPPPLDYTGEFGVVPDDAQIRSWCDEYPDGNLCLRLIDAIGIDIDHYSKTKSDGTVVVKRGGETLERWTEIVGEELEATVVSSARRRGGDLVSGTRMYRVPRGISTAGWSGGEDDIDLIKQDHRYTVVWPSRNPDADGALYEWYDERTGEFLTEPPVFDELPELSMAWVRFFASLKVAARRKSKKKDKSLARATGEGVGGDIKFSDLLDAPADPMCGVVKDRLAKALTDMNDPKSKHNVMLKHVMAFQRMDDDDHKGVATALAALRDVFVSRAQDRSPAAAMAEFQRMVDGAEKKLAENEGESRRKCRCPMPITDITGGVAERRHYPSVGELFNASGGLLTSYFQSTVLALGPIVRGEGDRLYEYRNGVYRPTGEDEVVRRAAWLLDDRYRQTHSSTAVTLLKAQEPFLDPDEPDARFINFKNGLLDLATLELQPHDPSVPSINQIPHNWNPAATCPKYDAWVQTVVTEDLVPVLHDVTGYAMYSGNPFHLAVLLIGSGANGKSTYIRVLKSILGRQNTSAVTPQSLDDNRFMAAELFGKLANIVGDVDPKKFTATERFKQSTGDDQFNAERKHGQPFDFTSYALTVAAFNKLPMTSDISIGFFRRWVVVPFSGYFPSGVADPSIEAGLKTEVELEGIIVRAVHALRAMLARRAVTPSQTSMDALEDFRRNADPVRRFVSEHIHPGVAANRVKFEELRTNFTRWANEEAPNYKPRAQDLYKSIAQAAQELYGIELVKRDEGGRRYYFPGITMTDIPFSYAAIAI